MVRSGNAWLAGGRAMVLDCPTNCALAVALDTDCSMAELRDVEVIHHLPDFFTGA